VKSFQCSSSSISSAAMVMKVYSSRFFSAAILHRSPYGNSSEVSHSIESRSKSVSIVEIMNDSYLSCWTNVAATKAVEGGAVRRAFHP
jgi:hypothetical protein